MKPFLLLVSCLALACTPPWVHPSNQDSGGAADASQSGCHLPFAGDPNGVPSMELTALTDGYVPVPVLDGGPIPMMLPPQGGRVIFVGVRATNVDPCQVRLGGVLRDPATQQVTLDARTTNLRITDGGQAVSVDTNITTFANIPVCPNQWASTNLDGNPFNLEITLTQRGGQVMTQTATVVPFCAEPANAAECRCKCQAGYVLGQPCGDAGVPDAATGDGGGGG